MYIFFTVFKYALNHLVFFSVAYILLERVHRCEIDKKIQRELKNDISLRGHIVK